MSDNPQVIFQVGVNQQMAQDAVRRIDSIRSSFTQARQEARALREVGTTLAGLGAAMVAPLALAAQNYAQKFKGLEEQANRYNAALAQQARANEALGRVAATVLTPQLEKVAAITQKIADFAAAHPDLVSAGLNIGAVLVTAGGAIAAVGHAERALVSVQRLMAGGGIAGSVANAIVTVGALAAGAKIAEVGLNKLGEATGNAYLEHYKLADALKTARQIAASAFLLLAQGISDASIALGRIKDIVEGVFTLAKDGIQKIILDLGNGIDKFIIGLASVLGKLGINTGSMATDASGRMLGRSIDRVGLDVESQSVGARLAQNDTDRQAAAKQWLAGLAKGAANFADTGSLGGPLDNIIKAIGDKIGGMFSGATSPSSSKSTIDPEAVRAFIDRNKRLADSDRQYNEEKKRLNETFNNEELKAQEKYNDDVAKANEKYQENALRDQETFNRERKRKEKDLEDTLKGLAASGDVAAFVEAQKQGKKDLSRQKEDFDSAQAEKAKQHAQELTDLQNTFQREEVERTRAHNEQLQQLREKHNQEREAIDRDFAEKLADLSSNLGNLNSIQNQYYQAQSQAMLDFVNRNMGYLQSLTGYTIGGGGTQSNPDTITTSVDSTGDEVFSSARSTGGRISRFASGLRRVPHDYFPMYADKDEAVLNKQQADSWRAGGVNVTIHNTVGDVATLSKLQEYHDTTVSAVKQVIADNAGRGA